MRTHKRYLIEVVYRETTEGKGFLDRVDTLGVKCHLEQQDLHGLEAEVYSVIELSDDVPANFIEQALDAVGS